MKALQTRSPIILIVGSILVLALLIAIAGCAQNSKGKTGVTSQTIVDSYDRKVEIPGKVEKIATIGSATRLCAYAGIIDKLIAITESDKEDITKPYTIAFKDEFVKLPTTNNGNHLNSTTVNKEKMLEISPDVILSTRSKDECEKLQEDLNIPVVGVYYQDELFSDDVYSAIKITGQVVGKTTEVDQTINYLKKAKADVEKRCKDIKNQAKVYRGAINYKGSKGLTGTISNYCVYEPLNIKNVADNEKINSAYDTTIEQIIAWDPDYMFYDCTNKNKVDLTAFSNKKQYFAAPFNRNGTNLEYGLCELYFTGKTVYPDAFSDVKLEEKFDEIFDKMLGKKIYSELTQKGIYFGQAS